MVGAVTPLDPRVSGLVLLLVVAVEEILVLETFAEILKLPEILSDMEDVKIFNLIAGDAFEGVANTLKVLALNEGDTLVESEMLRLKDRDGLLE